jgi:hypothetical protein
MSIHTAVTSDVERLWRSRRWRLMRRLDSEEEEKDRRMPQEKIER